MKEKSYTKEALLDITKEKNIRYIRLMFSDLNGYLKNIEIPSKQLESALNNEIMFDGSSVTGFTQIEQSDLFLAPDPDSWFILPNTDKEPHLDTACLICDIYQGKEPFIGDPRSNLQRLLSNLKAYGVTDFNFGAEPEFFLLEPRDQNHSVPYVKDNAGYFDLAPQDTASSCRRAIVEELEAIGFDIEANHHEAAPGQHEISWRFDTALKTCDKIQIFKSTVKRVAKDYNLNATFMPKPVFEIAGSGMHCNLSLFNGNKNLFDDSSKENGLSDLAEKFIAGLLAYVRSFTAITNPTINSYKRLVPHHEAPAYVAWSQQNRSALIRIPAQRGLATRIELRSADPTTNPYLAMAVILAAGLKGIEDNLTVPKPVETNIFDLTDNEREDLKINALPRSLSEAIDLFKNEPTIQSALGKHISSQFIHLKSKEVEEYHSHVTRWEFHRYLNN